MRDTGASARRFKKLLQAEGGGREALQISIQGGVGTELQAESVASNDAMAGRAHQHQATVHPITA
jgi:hypothetical protein